MHGAAALLATLAALRRARTPSEVLQSFTARAQAVVPSEVFGLYIFPDAPRRLPRGFVGHAPTAFLARYETLRPCDPLLREVLGSGATVDNLGLLGEAGWRRHPLSGFLADFGLGYSVQAPVHVAGDIVGTVNFARERGHGPYLGAAGADVRELALAVSDALEASVERAALEERLGRFGAAVTGGSTSSLPPRALTVAQLAARGLPNKVIARRVGISENTVKHHLKGIFAALGVANRTELAHHVAAFEGDGGNRVRATQGQS